jgi:nucleoside-diphosphate-sugar epimerase
MRAFVVGCGYLGRRLVPRLREGGWEIGALARGGTSAETLEGLGLRIFRGDLDDPGSLAGVPVGGAVLFHFAPPPRSGDADARTRGLLGAIAPGEEPSRIVYVSTSGVYGDCGGAWVDEDRPPNPTTPRAKRRRDAEEALLGFMAERGTPVVILRVPGIYGPGKLPLDRVRAGTPVVRRDECPFTNRIHVDDLASACLAAAQRGRPGAAYNVSDGSPGTMADYFAAIADRMGLPRPPQVTLDEATRLLSPGMLSFLSESRRLDTRRMREELGVEPRYPTLQEGLDQCFEEAPP